jgi:hypothetical protein
LSKNSRKLFSIYTALSNVKLFPFQNQSFIPIDLAYKMPHFDFEEGMNNIESQINNLNHGFKNTKDLNFLSYLDILGLDMLNYQELDRCSMYHSVEPRSPLSDFRIWEVILAIDENRKMSSGRKGLMKKLLKNRLPDYILNAKKDGFSNPFYIWFQEDNNLRKDILTIINKRKHLLYDILGFEYVNDILIKWNNRTNINWMDGIRLHQILVFVIWYYAYFENKNSYKLNLTLTEFSELL